MGLSGSGKSTVLRAINRLNTVARGTVTVEHEGRMIDVAKCDDRTLRELRTRAVAMVFQQFALLPWRTVRENVGFGLEVRGTPAAERRRIVDEKLALVGLSNWAEKYSDELSGGMQQRVGLARAFATDAPILLMDEPFSALDPLIRDKLQDELLDLQEKLRKTIVFVSHDLDEALKLGNRIAILEGGRIVQMGTRGGHPAPPGQRLRRRVRQAHEPAQRAPRHLGDDAGLGAAPRRRRGGDRARSGPRPCRRARPADRRVACRARGPDRRRPTARPA